jgi:hypothetical protein
MRKQINLQFPIYAVNVPTFGFSGYSFLGNSTQSSSTFNIELIGPTLASPEYMKFIENYQFVCLRGVSFRVQPATNYSQSNLGGISPIFIKAGVGTLPNNFISTAYADDAFEITSNMQPALVNYTFPPVLQGGSTYLVGGSGLWMSNGSLTANGVLNLLLGYIRPPHFENPAVAYYTQVFSVDVFVDVEFGSPQLFGA